MNLRIAILAAVFTVVAGCATAHKINNVQVGMTKEQVMTTMGKPASVSAKGGVEYLNYSLSETDDQAWYGITVPYYVRLVNGVVDAFGRMGDFDSTKTPTVRIESKGEVTHDVTTKASGDMYSELMKLKELRDSGVLTADEFESQKKKLLEKY